MLQLKASGAINCKISNISPYVNQYEGAEVPDKTMEWHPVLSLLRLTE
jgi:hypothetical protein